MDKLSQVSIKDFKTFKLIAPKGKIINKRIYDPFNKNTLSSIPSKIEIYMFNTNKEKDKLLFDKITKIIERKNILESSSSRLSSSNKSMKISSDIFSKTNSMMTINDYSKYNKSKSQIVLNKNEERFSDKLKKEFNDKYSPGPGQYNSNLDFHKNSNIRYNGLFIESNIKKKKNIINNEVPGPGTYNISNNEEIKNCIVNMDSKYKRFSDSKEQVIGPGSYFPDNLIQYNKFDWSKKIPSSFFRNNYSYFSELTKKENLLSKYIDIHKKEIFSPGPGEYFRNSFNYKGSLTSRNNNKLKLKKRNSLISDKIREEYKKSLLKEELLLKKDKSLYKNILKSSNSMIDIRSSFFKSNVDRTNIFPQKNHVPGPCYYG